MAGVVLGLGLLCLLSGGSAAPGKTYDQRQQGELNIHAQLDNIVIVLIPTSKISLMEMNAPQQNEDNLVTTSGHLVKPEKNGLLQFLQKHIKNDVDRYEVVKEEAFPHNENEVVSQGVSLNTRKENVEIADKEGEVVATVEEMKPSDVTEKTTTTPPKLEATEVTPTKEQPTVSETVQETVIKVSIPDKLKEAVKKAEQESKKDEKETKKPVKEVGVKESTQTSPPNSESAKKTQEIKATEESSVIRKETASSNKQESSLIRKETASSNKQESSASMVLPEQESSAGSSLDELIKPLAAKEPLTSSGREEMGDPRKPVASARKEKVIRYKPESKWAPGLVDLLGPVRQRSLDQEDRQRFSPLCSPGVWDAELKTCIMPGETRSRNELARFLEAMRFGIALPTQ